jgi:hypothetical protein
MRAAVLGLTVEMTDKVDHKRTWLDLVTRGAVPMVFNDLSQPFRPKLSLISALQDRAPEQGLGLLRELACAGPVRNGTEFEVLFRRWLLLRTQATRAHGLALPSLASLFQGGGDSGGVWDMPVPELQDVRTFEAGELQADKDRSALWVPAAAAGCAAAGGGAGAAVPGVARGRGVRQRRAARRPRRPARGALGAAARPGAHQRRPRALRGPARLRALRRGRAGADRGAARVQIGRAHV